MNCRCTWSPDVESPYGPVEDGESVCRVVSSPIHIGKEGVKASAIPNGQLRKGLSVVRLGFLPKDKFEDIAAAISATVPNGENVPAGVLVAKVKALRSLPDFKGQQALCVNDDATPETETVPRNDAHAIVIQAEDYSEEEIVRLKTELKEKVFGGLIKLSDLGH